MGKGKKRERNVNFTREETENLISLVEAYKTIIENKKSDAVTWQKKEKTWKSIELEFNNSCEGTFRDAKHLKLKYEALKRDTRKKSRVLRSKVTCSSNEKSFPLTPVEKKIKELISLSVDESARQFDSVKVDSYNIVQEVQNTLPKKRCLTDANDTAPGSFKEVHQDTPEMPQKKWTERKRAILKPKKYSALWKTKEKKAFDQLVKGKFEIVAMQKQLIKEELKEKLLKNGMLKNEIQHKQELHDLLIEEMLLKIELLKMELENKRKLL